jgi:hypothetical protein
MTSTFRTGIGVFAEMAGRVAIRTKRPALALARLGPRLALFGLIGSLLVTALLVMAELAGVALALQLATSINYLLWVAGGDPARADRPLARISLLDVQVIDADELPIGRVDDLEVEIDGGPPRVTAILIGSEALGGRIGDALGRAMAGVSARLREPGREPGPPRLPVGWIEELEPLLRIEPKLEDLEGVAGLEHWLARHFVVRLPGSGDEGK